MARSILFSLLDPQARCKGQWMFLDDNASLAAQLQNPRDGANPLLLRERRRFASHEELKIFAAGLTATGWRLTPSAGSSPSPATPPLQPRPTYPPIKDAVPA